MECPITTLPHVGVSGLSVSHDRARAKDTYSRHYASRWLVLSITPEKSDGSHRLSHGLSRSCIAVEMRATAGSLQSQFSGPGATPAKVGSKLTPSNKYQPASLQRSDHAAAILDMDEAFKATGLRYAGR